MARAGERKKEETGRKIEEREREIKITRIAKEPGRERARERKRKGGERERDYSTLLNTWE